MASPRRTARSPWLRAALAVVVFLVALESVLQLVAIAIAMPAPGHAPAPDSAVLCVGDSFTFGMGAKSPATSYPGQLAAALAARGLPDVQVTNGGYPGSHSGDILNRLPAQLTAATKVVCVLVGANDSWQRPRRLDVAALAPSAPGGFQWRWRTLRLVQILTRFDAHSWQADGNKPAAAPPEPASTATASDVQSGFALLAGYGLSTGPDFLGRYAGDPALPPERTAAFWERLKAQDLGGAAAIAATSVRDHPESPTALMQVVIAAKRQGLPDRANAALAELIALQAAKPSPAATESLLLAQSTIGQPEQAIATARRRIAEEPASMQAWDTLQQATFALGHREEGMAAMAETVRLLGANERPRIASIARNYARWRSSSPMGTAMTRVTQ